MAYTKLQRWTDLIAGLLAHNYPVTFDQLAREVPAYAAGLDPAHKESTKRTFERDKDELREFGVPIESISIEDGENTGYRLSPKKFYLPYLTVADSERASTPKPPGYRALPQVAFDPDELAVLAQSVARLEKLGDPMLADDARSAGAKLLFDIPFFDQAPIDVRIVDLDEHAEHFDVLADALRHHKTVTFSYRAPSTGAVTERHVDPYGLFFVYAHWYLAAFDRTRDGVRNFRVSRMSHVAANKKKPQTRDFDVPETFRLREHAQSRVAWDLGDGEQQVAEVRFVGTSGAVQAAARSGDAVTGRDDVRRFPVRRMDTFARWLLSFAGEAVPVAPLALVDVYRQLARDTLAVYHQ
ncbi:MAG: helix-turn-helix transcriptional regulator [Gemmatimonadaceae bacterium]